jgi:hypothetical protein
MWDEIQDMQGEIFDIDDNTGWTLFPSEEPYNEKEIDAMMMQFDDSWTLNAHQSWESVVA